MCENTYEPNQFGFVVYMDDSGEFGNPDADARLDYYGISSLPDLYFDGSTRVSGVGPDYEDGHAYVPIIEDHFNDVTPVAVRVVSYNYVSGNAEVTVEVEIIGDDLTGIDDTYLRVAVMEDGLQHWSYTFDHVVRTMIPDAQGTPLMVQHDGEVQRVTLPFALADMDPDELHVVAWVQRDTDRYVYNSANTRDFPYSASLTVTGQRQVLTAGGTVAFGVTTIANSGLEDDVFDLELDTAGLPASWNAHFVHDGIEGTSTTVTLASLEETQLDVIMEVASADHGRVTLTVYSQAAGVEVGAVDFVALPTGRSVLLVADDGIDDEIGDLLGAAISASGRTMATWDREVSAIDAETLGDFDGVVWACGNANPGLAEIDRTALDAYLEDGGRLLISGQDVAEDLVAQGPSGDLWLLMRSRCDLAADSTNERTLAGVAGDPVGDGLSFVLNGGDGADNQTDPDILEAATADAIPALRYGDGSLAGVHVEVSNWKVVFLAFGIEGIADAADRNEVMDRCLVWLIGEGPTAVGEAPPRAATLTPNRPNPFNPSTTLSYEVPTPGPVRLQVYDLRGRLVATLVDGHMAAGRHAARWSGRDGNGRDVPSGVYVARLLAGERIARQTMVLAR